MNKKTELSNKIQEMKGANYQKVIKRSIEKQSFFLRFGDFKGLRTKPLKLQDFDPKNKQHIQWVKENGIFIGAQTNEEDACSKHYVWRAENSGGVDRQVGVYTEGFVIQETVETIAGLVSTPKSVDGFLVKNIYGLDIQPLIQQMLTNDKVLSIASAVGRRVLELLHHVLVYDEVTHQLTRTLELSYTSVANLRIGTTDGVVTHSIVAEEGFDHLSRLEKAKVYPRYFSKRKGDTLSWDLQKFFTRPMTGNSTGRDVTLVPEGIIPVHHEEFLKMHQGDKIAQVKVDVYTYTWKDDRGKDQSFVVKTTTEDFTVIKEHEIHAPVFKGVKLSLENRRVIIEAPKTDGAMFMSYKMAKTCSTQIEGPKAPFYSAVQLRLLPTIKGLGQTVPFLKEELGADFLIFGGAMKSSQHEIFMQGGLNIAVLASNRRLKEVNVEKVSRQAYVNIFQGEKQVRVLTQENNKVWEKVKELTPDFVISLLNADLTNDEGFEEIGADNLIKALISSNPELMMQSGSVKNKVLDYIKGMYAKVTSGQFAYVSDASYNYLVSDPLAILECLKRGWISAKHENTGIKPNRVVLPIKDGTGKIGTVDGRISTIRFPMLHQEEQRQVNGATKEEDFYGLRFLRKYKRAIRAGYFHGCIVFSLWDMNAEGMSGADFDGDIALTIWNKEINEVLSQNSLFLDMSFIQDEDGQNEEFISGSPKSAEQPSLEDEVVWPISMTQEDKLRAKSLGLTFKDGTLTCSKETYMSYQYEVDDIIDKCARFLLVKSLEGNDIGFFTNILGTLTEAKQEAGRCFLASQQLGNKDLMKVFKEEVLGYRKLEYYFAMSIRWEIDKAKHGGAYKVFMPFLDQVFKDNEINLESIMKYEETFGISLQRLFLGVKFNGTK